MKTSTQLKALIRNLAKENDIKPEILLRNFMLERFLERIALSEYKDKFILKGGMLIASIVGIDARATMDMDATIIGFQLTDEELEKVIHRVLSATKTHPSFIHMTVLLCRQITIRSTLIRGNKP